MPSTLYILPSTAAVEAFTRHTLGPTGVIFGTHALTLRRLAEEVFTSADETRRHVSNVGRRLLLEEMVCERYRNETGHFCSLRDLPGFIGALDTLFAELKQALIEAPDFASTAGRISGNGRLPELAGLYLEYDRSLSAKGLLDRHDKELAALRHLQEGGGLPPLFEGVSAVRCLGIYDLSPLQLGLLAELSRRFPVELSLPWNPQRGTLYAYVARTADAVEALDNTDLQLEPVFAEPSGKFLTPLLAAVFDGEGAKEACEMAGDMALIAAPGPYRECEEIGRRIRRLLEAGTDPVTVAVVLRDVQRYGSMIEDVCRRFRIPVSYRRGAPLFTSPLVRACLAPFAVVGSRFAREELLGLIKSSYLGFPSGISLDAIEEVLVAAGYIDERVGAVETVVQKRIDWLRSQDRGIAREVAALAALRPLVGELRQFRTRQTLQSFTALLERYIERHHIYRKAITAADPLTLKRDASAITLFRQVLHDLEQDMRTLGIADEPMEPGEFVSLLKHGMEGAFLAGERGAGVAIMNFHDARGLSFDHLFVGGLNEGVCPMSREGHPLFKDADKLLFRRVSGTRSFRIAKEKGEEEQLLFYLALGCADKSLTFSYSYINSQGNEMLPSPFLDELLTKVPLAEERIPVNRITPAPAECLEREEFLNSLAAHRLFSWPQDGLSCLGESVARIEGAFRMETERERFFETEEKALRGILATPHTGKLLREDILAELRLFYESPAGNRFAPTTLEDYGCCPFRFFLRRLLKLSPFDKPEMELAAREEGSLIHEVLCAFFRRLQNEGRLPLKDTEDAKAVLREVAEPIFERWERERHIGQPLLWEIEKEKLLVLLEQLIEIEAEDGSRFLPVLFEHPFEDLVVEDDDGSRILLAGKIDRVDTAAAGSGEIRVVDYKMGGDAGKYRALLKKEQLGRTSFQMPIYLLAAARAMAAASNEPVTRFSATYWLLRKLCMLNKDFAEGKEDFTGFFDTDPVSRGALGDDNFANRVVAMVQAIKSGDFQITPNECQFCDFGCVCRHVEVRLRDDAGDGD